MSAPMCKRRDCFNAAFSEGYCGAHLREKREGRNSYRAALTAERDRLKAERDALLAALKECVEWAAAFACYAAYPGPANRAVAAARAAILKAEGGAK